MGYTPEQVYNLFFPEEFRFLCNPERPAVCGRFGLPEDRLWRFEFVVCSGEDGYEMAKRDMIREVVFPYITHQGHRYGLVQCLGSRCQKLKTADVIYLGYKKMSNSLRTVSMFYGPALSSSLLEVATSGRKTV